MEYLTSNLSGNIRQEVLHGKTYIVAPVTLIVPGVLNGSRGPLYYPPDELEGSVYAWNNIPIVVNHPSLNGSPVSARRPDVLNQYGVGYVFSVTMNGKLSGEAWVDVEQAKRIAPTLIENILKGEKIEVSTGVATDNRPPAGVYNSIQYSAVARNYKPDHLAILVGAVGACSRYDGCGINNQSALSVTQNSSGVSATKIASVVFSTKRLTSNVFCPTGPGGGVDPTCKAGGSGGGGAAGGDGAGKVTGPGGGIGAEAVTKAKPPPYKPDVTHDADGDGVTDHARVGVKADSVPPEPPIGRLPNLTKKEREVETAFADAYEKNPDGMASKYRDMEIQRAAAKGQPPTFATDDAKMLSSAWNGEDLSVRSENRAQYNVALHQTANAMAKRAFLQHLDTLSPGDEITVTVGGCGAGKGYAMGADKKSGQPFVPEAFEMKSRAKAVWDSAGDQNATENPWILKEAAARGLKVNYVYVHADPKTQWAHPDRGVVKRAGDPNDGRMVDAKVFADSYAIGARNHEAFYQANKGNSNVKFVFLENGNPPKKLSGVPADALKHDRRELAKFALETVRSSASPPHVKRGGSIGERIWDDI